MAHGTDARELFHPLIRQWFADRMGEPTEVQLLTWPRIAGGEHVLVTAPTGSGKTLAAFLWALDRLLSGALPGGQVRVLYVSPLRALNNDIRRNLLAPLEELRARFEAAGASRPASSLPRPRRSPGGAPHAVCASDAGRGRDLLPGAGAGCRALRVLATRSRRMSSRKTARG